MFEMKSTASNVILAMCNQLIIQLIVFTMTQGLKCSPAITAVSLLGVCLYQLYTAGS